MIQRNLPSPDPSNPATLRAARIESRATPLSAIKSEHNARHRTKSQDRAQLAAALQTGEPSSSGRIFEVPTAQRDGDGDFVYTKKPLWYETGKVQFMSGRSKVVPPATAAGNKAKDVVDDVVRGADGIFEDVKERVSGFFRK